MGSWERQDRQRNAQPLMMLPNWLEEPLAADDAGRSASERYEPSNAWIDASRFACEREPARGWVSALL